MTVTTNDPLYSGWLEPYTHTVSPLWYRWFTEVVAVAVDPVLVIVVVIDFRSIEFEAAIFTVPLPLSMINAPSVTPELHIWSI